MRASRRLEGVGDGANGERHGDALAIFGRGVQVGHRLRCPPSAALTASRTLPSSKRFGLQRLRHRIEPQRHGGRSADADGRARAAAVGVERDLRRGRHEGEIALPRVDLVEAHADPRLRPHRKARLGEACGQRQRGHHRTEKEIGRRHGTVRAAVAPDQCRAERRRNQHDLRRPIAVGERAADRAARPRRRMPDERHHLGEQRQLGPDERIAFDHMLSGRGADRDVVALVAHISEAGNPRDVDQPRRPRQPHRHQRHQRLPARDHARAIVGRKQRAGLVDVGGTRILERSRLHRQCQYGG